MLGKIVFWRGEKEFLCGKTSSLREDIDFISRETDLLRGELDYYPIIYLYITEIQYIIMFLYEYK